MGETLVDRMHREIEIMTRRLELEKRRLKRLDKELEAAQKTQGIKEQQARERQNAWTRRPKSGGPARPKSGSGAAAARSLQAGRGQNQAAFGGRQISEPTSENTAQEEGERFTPMRQLVAQMDSQVKKLDSVKHENDCLKQDVQQIRKYKKQLGSIFDRLKLQILKRSDQLRDFVEEAAQSKAVYSETEQRVEVMQRQRDDERRQFTEEVLRIRRDLRKLETEKREVEVRLKRMEKGVQRKNELILPPEEEEFSEASMMRRIMKTAFLNCIQRRHIKQHQKSIEIFEQAFATIKQSTGISDIAEIVKIFVHLESRNYSLLTYVNHMNREIEALEGQKRARQEGEWSLKRKEESAEKSRKYALGDMQQKLRSIQLATEDDREACEEHRGVLHQVLPLVAQVAKHLDLESQRLRQASKDENREFPQKPSDELRVDTMLIYLQWVEDVLSRFKDLLPVQDSADYFPPTAAGLVKQLQPKSRHQPAARLVKMQDLPAAPLFVEEHGASKRQVNTAKVELEEDSEDEGFEERPLKLEEIRHRAKQAHERKNRTREHRHSTAFIEQEAASSTGLQLFTQDVQPAPRQSTSDSLPQSRRSVGFSLSAANALAQDAQAAETLRLEAHAALPEAGEQSPDSQNSDSQSAKEPLPYPSKSALNMRVRQLIQVAASRPAEVTQDELDITFLRKYKMSRQELEVRAKLMGMGLQHLCFLKTQFDLFDQDQSGRISASELRSLFQKLGEDITESSLAEAVHELDADQSGEIEFFEFVDWFTAK